MDEGLQIREESIILDKVYVTGRGVISPLGCGVEANSDGLFTGRSGLVFMPDWQNEKLDSQVAGKVEVIPESPLLDRKRRRFCARCSEMSVIAVNEALQEAQIPLDQVRHMNIALVGGVAGSNFLEIYESSKAFSETRRMRVVSPFSVPRVMPSSAVANLSLIFGFTGESFNVSAACASSAISVITAARMIKLGLYDIIVCGGAEQLDWLEALGFNGMRALSTKYNETPTQASRPFDRSRDGFVLAEGAGYFVLESERSMLRRGVKPICEIAGCGSSSNASDMVVPNAEMSALAMQIALKDAGIKPEAVAYVNTHGTATPVGDPVELNSIRSVFGDRIAINSTKSQTGHMVGATGAVELIFTSIMMEKSFISANLNFVEPDAGFEWADIVRTRRMTEIDYAISNSFAFGGSNASVILGKVK